VKGLRVLLVLGVVLVVSLIAGAYAAGQDSPPLTAAQAREFTQRAFTYSGVEPVEVSGEPRAEVFDQSQDPESGEGEGTGPGDPIPVWVVPAQVANQPVELYVARESDRAVRLNDALPGGGFVLNDEQFKRLEEFRLDLAGEELRRQRQGPAVAAVVLVVAVSLLLLVVVVRRRDRSGSGGGGAPTGSTTGTAAATPAPVVPMAGPAPPPLPTPAPEPAGG